MMSRLGFCCTHAYAQAKAMTIVRRGMLLMNRVIGSPVLVRCRVLLYFITLFRSPGACPKCRSKVIEIPRCASGFEKNLLSCPVPRVSRGGRFDEAGWFLLSADDWLCASAPESSAANARYVSIAGDSARTKRTTNSDHRVHSPSGQTGKSQGALRSARQAAHH